MTNLPGSSILFRLIAIFVLLSIAVLLIFITPSQQVDSPTEGNHEIASFIDSIDRGIDTLYREFGIEARNIRKSEIIVPGAEIIRREHRVSVPSDFITIIFNQRLNLLAENFGGTAHGSEDSKKKNVTMHMRFGKAITHSIVLRPAVEKAKTPAKTKKRK